VGFAHHCAKGEGLPLIPVFPLPALLFAMLCRGLHPPQACSHAHSQHMPWVPRTKGGEPSRLYCPGERSYPP
jgi:hypothetical protein